MHKAKTWGGGLKLMQHSLLGKGWQIRKTGYGPQSIPQRPALPYRQGPADTGEHTVNAEEMHQVKGEDHDEVADGDHFKVAVGTVAGPCRTPHADEGDEQRDLRSKGCQRPGSPDNQRDPPPGVGGGPFPKSSSASMPGPNLQCLLGDRPVLGWELQSFPGAAGPPRSYPRLGSRELGDVNLPFRGQLFTPKSHFGIPETLFHQVKCHIFCLFVLEPHRQLLPVLCLGVAPGRA